MHAPDGIRGAGDRNKVSFHDGATFVPYLGRNYPTNQPLRGRTLSAKVGDQELATVTQPRVTYDGLRAEYELGAIVEACDIRAEDLEQTFVISARPEVPGDLVIRGTLDPRWLRTPAVPSMPVSSSVIRPACRSGATARRPRSMRRAGR